MVGIKVWFLLEIIEREWHENTEGRKNDKNSKKDDKKAKVKKSNKSMTA